MLYPSTIAKGAQHYFENCKSNSKEPVNIEENRKDFNLYENKFISEEHLVYKDIESGSSNQKEPKYFISKRQKISSSIIDERIKNLLSENSKLKHDISQNKSHTELNSKLNYKSFNSINENISDNINLKNHNFVSNKDTNSKINSINNTINSDIQYTKNSKFIEETNTGNNIKVNSSITSLDKENLSFSTINKELENLTQFLVNMNNK